MRPSPVFLLWLHELSTVKVLTVFPTLSFLVNIINRDKHKYDHKYDHHKYVNIFLGQMLYCAPIRQSVLVRL